MPAFGRLSGTTPATGASSLTTARSCRSFLFVLNAGSGNASPCTNFDDGDACGSKVMSTRFDAVPMKQWAPVTKTSGATRAPVQSGWKPAGPASASSRPTAGCPPPSGDPPVMAYAGAATASAAASTIRSFLPGVIRVLASAGESIERAVLAHLRGRDGQRQRDHEEHDCDQGTVLRH